MTLMTGKTSSKNVTSCFFNNVTVIQSHCVCKCVLTILELNWNQRFLDNKTKLDMISYAHVIQTTAKQIISRRRKNENVFKMSKEEKCTCKACNNTVFHCQICKFVGLLLQWSWLLKLPINNINAMIFPFNIHTPPPPMDEAF